VSPKRELLRRPFRRLCPLGAKVVFDLGLPRVPRPADNRIMAWQDGLMQRRRVGMVFAGIEEQPYDLHVPVLRRRDVIDARAAPDKGFSSAQVSERESRHQRRSPPWRATPFDRCAKIQRVSTSAACTQATPLAPV